MTVQTHRTAIVEDQSTVGAGTRIWHHAHVRSGARIGQDCNVGKNVYIDSGVRIGSRVKIQNNVSVYRGVSICDDVFIGPSVVFTNDLRPRARSTGWSVMPTLVKTGASIGANATILCGIEIGENAMVAAGAVVTRTVHPYELVVGNPATRHGWVCACGVVLSRCQARPTSITCSSCSKQAEAAPK